MTSPTCRVCCFTYNEDENLPLFLPCSRTLCRSCVKRVVKDDNSMRCPVCYGNHASVYVDQLNVNRDILDITVQDLDVEEQTSIPKTQVILPGQDSNINIVLRNLNGTVHLLKVPSSATISEVKQAIKDQQGFEPTTTRLFFQGRKLEDNHTLSFHKAKDGNTLQLLTNYLGGGSGREERD